MGRVGSRFRRVEPRRRARAFVPGLLAEPLPRVLQVACGKRPVYTKTGPVRLHQLDA